MKALAAWGVVAGLCSTVRADSARDIPTRAHRVRLARHVIGGAALAAGATLAGLGYWSYSNAKEGGLVDLSTLDRGIGWFLLGTGSISLVGGVTILAGGSSVETANDEIQATMTLEDRDLARRRISGAVEHHRSVMRSAGLAMFVVGAASMATIAATSIDLDSKAGAVLGAGGASLAFVGLTTALGSLSRSDVETAEPVRSAGIVPVRGGAIAGIGGVF